MKRNFEIAAMQLPKDQRQRKSKFFTIPTVGGDADVRPGKRLGLSVSQVRDLIKREKRCKGFNFDLATGDNNNLRVQLPGTAYVWLGFVFSFSKLQAAQEPDGTCSLVINNETVVEDVFVQFFGPDFTDEEYYFIPRPLSGQDDVKFVVNGVSATYTLNVNTYYL